MLFLKVQCTAVVNTDDAWTPQKSWSMRRARLLRYAEKDPDAELTRGEYCASQPDSVEFDGEDPGSAQAATSASRIPGGFTVYNALGCHPERG